MDFEIGQRVIVKPVWDGWLSKPKYPNRTGTVIQKNSVDEQLHEQTLILPTTQEST